MPVCLRRAAASVRGDALMDIKHTPGPWMADGWGEIEDGVPIIAVHEENGLRSPTRGIVAWCTTIAGAAFESPERAYANARLIAAAPELLEAAQPFVAHNSGDETITITVKTEDVRRLRAAIAKATGAKTP